MMTRVINLSSQPVFGFPEGYTVTGSTFHPLSEERLDHHARG